MNRTLRWFLIVLAVLLAMSFGSYSWYERHSGGGREFRIFDMCTLAAYVAAAASWLWSGRSLSKIGLSFVSLAGVTPALTGLIQTMAFSENAKDTLAGVAGNRILEIMFAATLLPVMGLAAWLTSRPAPVPRSRVAIYAAILGCLVVLSSLFLAITYGENTEAGTPSGLTVLDRQNEWITGYASVGQSAFLGDGSGGCNRYFQQLVTPSTRLRLSRPWRR